MKKLITVFGPSTVKEDTLLYREAELLGKLLAQAGFNVVNGGYGGIMEAVSKGASASGAGVVAVTAEVYSARGLEPNAFITREVKVKSAIDRLMELVDLADACIAIGTSPGTLLEVITVWEFTLKKFIGKRPIILLGKEWEQLGVCFDIQENMRHHRESLTYVEDATSAVLVLEAYFGRQQKLPELNVMSS